MQLLNPTVGFTLNDSPIDFAVVFLGQSNPLNPPDTQRNITSLDDLRQFCQSLRDEKGWRNAFKRKILVLEWTGSTEVTHDTATQAMEDLLRFFNHLADAWKLMIHDLTFRGFPCVDFRLTERLIRSLAGKPKTITFSRCRVYDYTEVQMFAQRSSNWDELVLDRSEIINSYENWIVKEHHVRMLNINPLLPEYSATFKLLGYCACIISAYISLADMSREDFGATIEILGYELARRGQSAQHIRGYDSLEKVTIKHNQADADWATNVIQSYLAPLSGGLRFQLIIE